MGITIYYKGKAKSLEAIDALIEHLRKTSERFNWDHELVEEEIKGELCPSWGYGFGSHLSKISFEGETPNR